MPENKEPTPEALAIARDVAASPGTSPPMTEADITALALALDEENRPPTENRLLAQIGASTPVADPSKQRFADALGSVLGHRVELAELDRAAALADSEAPIAVPQGPPVCPLCRRVHSFGTSTCG